MTAASCREDEDSHGTAFQIDAVRQEFNAVTVDKDEALQKRLERLTRDRCTNYRKKVHNLQVELQHNCNGLGLTDPGRELEAIRFRSRMEAVQVLSRCCSTASHLSQYCHPVSACIVVQHVDF